MNPKRVVIIGFVITSLLTSLAMFELLPGYVGAVIVFVGGIMLTYYMALSQKRMERLGEMSFLLRAVRSLHARDREQEICSNIVYWAGRLAKSEHVFVWAGDDELNEEIIEAWPEWRGLNRLIKENKTTVLFNRRDKASPLHPQPDWIHSFIALPIIVNERIIAILYLVNEQGQEFFDEGERGALEEICLQAALAWQKNITFTDTQEFYLSIIKTAIRALESHNPLFLGHGERVAALSCLLGSKLGLDEEELKVLQISALLHDAGRFMPVRQDDEGDKGTVLLTPSIDKGDVIGTMRKCQENRPLVTRVLGDGHPCRGAEIFPAGGIYEDIKAGIRYHHERYDGSGYPEGLERTEIPQAARIIAVADLYDAMTRLCPEEERVDHKKALQDIKTAMGSLLDPLVVVVLEEIETEMQEMIK